MNDEIIIKNEFMESNPEVNARLEEAGYTHDQIQVFYDVIAEELMPVIEQLLLENNQASEKSKLDSYFGGAEKTREVMRQVNLWGKKNLRPDILQALSSSADGIIALYQMMSSSEPGTADLKGGKETHQLSEKELKQLMTTPAYWRDKDPTVVSKVEDGFKRLYDKA